MILQSGIEVLAVCIVLIADLLIVSILMILSILVLMEAVINVCVTATLFTFKKDKS